jgi:AcrR family transcriptional regulator
LIDLGLELFADQPYDDVWIDGVADKAGISRGLLYHYFPTKREFYRAVMQTAVDRVFAATAAPPGASFRTAARGGIDAFLAAVSEQPHGYLTAYRGSLSADPEIRAVANAARTRQTDRIVALLPAVDASSERRLRSAVHGWTAMAQDMTARWIEDGEPEAAEVCDILYGALVGAVRAAGGRLPRT